MPTNPLVSPLFGDPHGLPPLLFHVAAEEALRDDGLRFAEKARAAGVHVETSVWPVVPHAWQLLARLPEAKRSIARATEFLKTAAPDAIEHLDVIIVGAGLSGIGAAVHLQKRLPRPPLRHPREPRGDRRHVGPVPLSRRALRLRHVHAGLRFKPWTDAKSLADGPAIRDYIVDTAVEHGIDRQIRFGHKVVRADWSSADARWTLEIEHAPMQRRASRLSCNFLLACSGYYRYTEGHAPEFPGAADFRGRLVHPQFWPADLDYAGKRVVVIGSGATAVTLVPEMARTAAHVTMLQRSPTYVLSLPARDPIADTLRRRLPRMLAYRLTRTKNIGVAMLFFKLSRRWPAKVQQEPHRHGAPGARAGARRRHALHAHATTRGTSACASCPTATCSRPSSAAAPRSSPTTSTLHRPTASA